MFNAYKVVATIQELELRKSVKDTTHNVKIQGNLHTQCFSFEKNTHFCFILYLLEIWSDLHKNFSECSCVNSDFSRVKLLN